MKGSLTIIVALLALLAVAPVYAVTEGILVSGCEWLTGPSLACGASAVYECDVNTTYVPAGQISSFALWVDDGIGSYPSGARSYSFSLYSGNVYNGTWRASVPVSYFNNATAEELVISDSYGASCRFLGLDSADQSQAGCEYLSPSATQSYVSSCQCTLTQQTYRYSNNTCVTEHTYVGCDAESVDDYTTTSYCDYCQTNWTVSYSACVFNDAAFSITPGDGLMQGTAIKTYSPAPGDTCYYRSGATPDDTTPPPDNGREVVCRADGWYSSGKDWELSGKETATPWTVLTSSYQTYSRSGAYAVDVNGKAIPPLSGTFGGSQGMIVFNDTSTVYVLDATGQSVRFSYSLPGAVFFSDASIWGQDIKDYDFSSKQYDNDTATGVAFIYFNATDSEYYFRALKYTGSGFALNYTFSIDDLSGNGAFGSGVTCADNTCYFIGNDNKLYVVSISSQAVVSHNPNSGVIVETDSRITPVVLSRYGSPRAVAWVGTSDALVPAWMVCSIDGSYCDVESIIPAAMYLRNVSKTIVVSTTHSTFQSTYDLAFVAKEDDGVGGVQATTYVNTVTGSYTGNTLTGVSWGSTQSMLVDSTGGGEVDCVGDPVRASCGVGKSYAVPTHWAQGTGGGSSPVSGISPLDISAEYNNRVALDSHSQFPGTNAGLRCTRGYCYGGTYSPAQLWYDQGARDWLSIPLPTYVSSILTVGAQGGKAYLLASNSSGIFAMRYSPSEGFTILSAPLSGYSFPAAANPGYGMYCWEPDGGGCTATYRSGGGAQWAPLVRADSSGFIVIKDSGVDEVKINNGVNGSSCAIYDSVQQAIKIGSNYVFADLDPGAGSNKLYRITGFTGGYADCTTVDATSGISIVGPFVSGDSRYAYVGWPDRTGGTYVVSNETNISLALESSANNFGVDWMNLTWGPVIENTAYMRTMTPTSSIATNTNRKVYLGTGNAGNCLLELAAYHEHTQVAKAVVGSDGFTQVEFSVAFGGSGNCLPYAGAPTPFGGNVLLRFNTQTGLEWPYLVEVPDGRQLPAYGAFADAYGSPCDSLDTGAGSGCTPGIADESSRARGYDSSNYGYRPVPMDKSLTQDGMLYYSTSGSIVVPDPIGPYQDVSCIGLQGSGTPYRVTRVVVPTDTCQKSIASVDYDNDGVDEVAMPAGLYRYSDNRQVLTSGLSGANDPNATVIVSDLNYDTYADIGILTDTLLASVLSQNPWTAAYGRSLSVGETTCQNIGGTIYAGITKVVANSPPDVAYTAEFKKGGVVVGTDGAYALATGQYGTVSNGLSYTPTVTGTYDVQVTAFDPSTGERKVASSCSIDVTVSTPQVTEQQAITCSLGEGGEFNYVTPVTEYGFSSSGPAQLDGRKITLSQSNTDAYSTLSKYGLSCSESLVNVTIKLNATSGSRWSFVVYGDASDGANELVRTQFANLLYDGSQVNFYSTYDDNPGFARVTLSTTAEVEYSLIIDKTNKQVTAYVNGVAKRTDAMFNGTGADLVYDSVMIGDVRGVLFSLPSGAASIDFIRVEGTGAKVTVVSPKDNARAALAGCTSPGERDFAVNPPGNFNQSFYPSVLQYCSIVGSGKVGASKICTLSDLSTVVNIRPTCYQEAFNYCVGVALPNDPEYDQEYDPAETTLSGASLCTTVLGAKVATKSVLAPMGTAALTVVKNSWSLILIVVAVIFVIALAGSAWKSRGR